MDRTQGSFTDDAAGNPGTVQLVQDILRYFVVIQSLIVVVDGDTLTECLVDRLAEDIVEVGFPAEDEGKTVHGIIPVVHQHLDIIQNTVVEVLCFINSRKKRLVFITVQIGDLLLDRFEHGWFSAFIGNAKDGAELLVKVSDTDRGQAHVFHVVPVRVQALCEAPEGIRLSHAGESREDSDAADVFQMIEYFGAFAAQLEISLDTLSN